MNNKIKKILDKKNASGISTSSLIKQTGLSRSQFYAIANGVSIPKLDNAMKMAEVLGVTIDELFTDTIT